LAIGLFSTATRQLGCRGHRRGFDMLDLKQAKALLKALAA